MPKLSRFVITALLAATPLVAAIGDDGAVAHAAEPGAIVRKGIGCGLFLPGRPELSTSDVVALEAPSGFIKLTCHFNGPAVPQTMVMSGFKCSIDRHVTSDTHLVYAKSGQATLTCQVKARP
jgi:hypothetical protein